VRAQRRAGGAAGEERAADSEADGERDFANFPRGVGAALADGRSATQRSCSPWTPSPAAVVLRTPSIINTEASRTRARRILGTKVLVRALVGAKVVVAEARKGLSGCGAALELLGGGCDAVWAAVGAAGGVRGALCSDDSSRAACAGSP
jgi:hypothetical protein